MRASHRIINSVANPRPIYMSKRDAAIYEAKLRRLILRPLFRQMRAGSLRRTPPRNYSSSFPGTPTRLRSSVTS